MNYFRGSSIWRLTLPNRAKWSQYLPSWAKLYKAKLLGSISEPFMEGKSWVWTHPVRGAKDSQKFSYRDEGKWKSKVGERRSCEYFIIVCVVDIAVVMFCAVCVVAIVHCKNTKYQGVWSWLGQSTWFWYVTWWEKSVSCWSKTHYLKNSTCHKSFHMWVISPNHFQLSLAIASLDLLSMILSSIWLVAVFIHVNPQNSTLKYSVLADHGPIR